MAQAAVLDAPVLAILGPTGTGKSAFAITVALALQGEILSCDSMAVYRNLDIGTAKVPLEERCGVPHHLIDVVDPGESFSAGAFRERALEVLAKITGRGSLPILVGGTGLYARAILQGIAPAPSRDTALRERLGQRAALRGPKHLHTLLQRLDPARASQLPTTDTLRLVRALEVRLLSGRPMSALLAESPYGSRGLSLVLRIGLTAPKPLLYNRIEARVDTMMAQGFLEEVQDLERAGCLVGAARRAIGYGELADHLRGRISLVEAVGQIKRRSRNLAKRQMTWFRGERDIEWFATDREAWEDHAIERIRRWKKTIGSE